jgi:hypothetical protein
MPSTYESLIPKQYDLFGGGPPSPKNKNKKKKEECYFTLCPLNWFIKR